MNAKNKKLAGRPPLYTKPSDLMQSVFAYLAWVSSNPLSDWKLTSKGALIEVPKKRYPTIAACARFCGVAPRTWRSWKNEKHHLYEVVEFAELVILQIKMEGVAVGMFRPSIVARDLRLNEDLTCEDNFVVCLLDNIRDLTTSPAMLA